VMVRCPVLWFRITTVLKYLGHILHLSISISKFGDLTYLWERHQAKKSCYMCYWTHTFKNSARSYQFMIHLHLLHTYRGLPTHLLKISYCQQQQKNLYKFHPQHLMDEHSKKFTWTARCWWWLIPVILLLERLRWEGSQCETNPGK
jgi:hypothetical protein